MTRSEEHLWQVAEKAWHQYREWRQGLTEAPDNPPWAALAACARTLHEALRHHRHCPEHPECGRCYHSRLNIDDLVLKVEIDTVRLDLDPTRWPDVPWGPRWDVRYLSPPVMRATPPLARLHAWAGKDQCLDMGYWIDNDRDAFESAVWDELCAWGEEERPGRDTIVIEQVEDE